MNLLPKTSSEFSEEEYWNKFFSKRGARSFEWYGEYPQLCNLLHKYIRPSDHLLIVGCGNSSLSADLYDAGYHANISIDISDVVIRQMKDKYVKDRPGISFLKMDMLQMSFNDEEFSVVLDKGTLDALMSDDTEEINMKVDQMFVEIWRVLRLGGRYICVSLLQEYILRKILCWFINEGWMIRIHRCIIEEYSDVSVFPVFMVVCTKMKKLPGQKPIIEVALEDESAPKRLENLEVVMNSIKVVQQYSFLRHHLATKKLTGEDVSVDLCAPFHPHPRYTLHIVDRAEASSLKYAIFIVPQGRETEWLFATSEGRKQLAETANSERLAVVHLNRNHVFENLDEVKSELSGKVLELAPANLRANTQVPFLSAGEDIGKREVRHFSSSPLSGDFVIEDVTGENGQIFRRLIFLSNQNVVQSEARLIEISNKKKRRKDRSKTKGKLEIDNNYLSCQHHTLMIAGLAFLDIKMPIHMLLVGLGGGCLATYVHHHLTKISLDVVELDSAVATIAKDWFGLETDDRLNVFIADGVAYIQDAVQKGKHYDAVLLDVDNKDSSLGISCPPAEFLSISALNNVHSLISPSGIMVLNLVCRDQALRSEIYSKLTSIFCSICYKKIEEEVNEVVFASSSNISSLPTGLKSNLSELMNHLNKQPKDNVDITQLMSTLEIIR